MNPTKADAFLTLLHAASHYRRGEQIYARAVVDSMEDPLDDALRLIGVLMAASANLAEAAKREGVAIGYVSRPLDPRQ